MKKLAVFYHIWAPEESGTWALLVDEQIKKLISSRLAYNASVYCCINSKQHEKIRDFVSQYKFIEILESSSNESDYEAFTLKHLYDFCIKNDIVESVLYFHTKGIRHFSFPVEYNVVKNVNSWRKFLEYGTIDKWREAVLQLQNHDVAGSNFHLHPRKHFQGNFWWATKNYIRRLDNPLSRTFADESFCHPEQVARVGCEMWIGSGDPKWFSDFNYPFDLESNTSSFDLYGYDIFPEYIDNSF
ncbi:hypothetical protein [Gluconobacter cerinus]|uniref:hypothetical protein n=1 Tax=Gluconobacter cerinus TaxID=38307 RepID=UPI001B8D00E0|nr:hypothetical protein [Gluconobacter cerinus]MBS0995888.1 hypothetical protein [Gluconobacter cerinus]